MRLDEPARTACLAKLAAEARTDYLTNLLLPADTRDAHMALRAFHAELVALPFKVREAIAGQIRLQWWRDVIERERDDRGSIQPRGRRAARLAGCLSRIRHRAGGEGRGA